MNSYAYRAYGLNFESSFPLPELMPRESGTPDVKISCGKVPETLPFPSNNGLAWQSAPGKLLLTVSEIGRYLIIDNRQIIIEPLPGVSEKSVRIFLLGTILGALLHSRQILVLHSSVIETERGAVLFMGSSGAGKSTLLSAFLKRGYAMAADDKAGIVLNGETRLAEALPAFPYARLTRETVAELCYPADDSQMVEGLGKYVVPVENFCSMPLKIHAAYSLNPYNQREIRFESLPTLDKFQILNRHTYRRRFLHEPAQREAHFKMLGILSAQAKVKKIYRPDDASLINDLVDKIEEDFSA